MARTSRSLSLRCSRPWPRISSPNTSSATPPKCANIFPSLTPRSPDSAIALTAPSSSKSSTKTPTSPWSKMAARSSSTRTTRRKPSMSPSPSAPPNAPSRKSPHPRPPTDRRRDIVGPDVVYLAIGQLLNELQASGFSQLVLLFGLDSTDLAGTGFSLCARRERRRVPLECLRFWLLTTQPGSLATTFQVAESRTPPPLCGLVFLGVRA